MCPQQGPEEDSVYLIVYMLGCIESHRFVRSSLTSHLLARFQTRNFEIFLSVAA